jgi:hypothetical protein
MLARLDGHMIIGSFIFAGAMTMPSHGALLVESIGAGALVLILVALCDTGFQTPRRPVGTGDDAGLRLLLMLIMLTVAVRWASQAATAGSVSDRAACMARCSPLGGIQSAYSDAEGAHCICRYP